MRRSEWLATILGIAMFSAPATLAARVFDDAYVAIERYDVVASSHEISLGSGENFVIFGDEVDLARQKIEPLMFPHEVQNLAIVARELRIGPDTRIAIGGSYSPGNAPTSGANLLLIAPKIVLDGADPESGNLGRLLELQRDGGVAPNNPIFNGAKGRVIVRVDSVTLTDRYIAAKVKAMSPSGAAADLFVPQSILRAIAKNFSPNSSIHAMAERQNAVKWSGLGTAYAEWTTGDPPDVVLKRELGLTYEIPETAFGGPDEVRSFGEAASALSGAILGRWYNSIMTREAAVVRGLFAIRNYEAAGKAILALKPLLGTVPNATLTSSEYSNALNAIMDIEEQLKQRRVVETIQIPGKDTRPGNVTVIRDLVPTEINLLPTTILLQPLTTAGGFRVGFFEQQASTQTVKLSLNGRLAVDVATLASIKKTAQKLSPAVSVVAGSDEIDYGTLIVPIDGVQTQNAQITSGGLVSIDLNVPQDKLVQVFLRLAQPFGVPVSVEWSWKQPRDRPVPLPLSLALGLRTVDRQLQAVDGRISNVFDHPVEIDYVIDQGLVHHQGFPIKLAPGASTEQVCNELCVAPPMAIRHSLDLTNPISTFEPIAGQAALVAFDIRNTIGDDPQRGGQFQSMTLTFSYQPTPNSSPQIAGPVAFDANGKAGSHQVLRFIGPANGGGTLSAAGRVHWGIAPPYSYSDLEMENIGANVVKIDAAWFRR
ncbi:hypothetical protein ASF91_13525 [Rhizobium sp. Leaf155]|nr:hypothetical protein ASF91_13525 [Rhizobium sp. Leaf155]